MRVEFAEKIRELGESDKRLVFLSGDLGFMALEEVQGALGNRFINAGVAEQNMISVAAGVASTGLLPFVYSIVPFATLRPLEQIRNDICLHNLPVKIVGNGGGYGYGIMGATHHGLEDVGAMRLLPNMRIFVPVFDGDVSKALDKIVASQGPCYLRLGRSAQTPVDTKLSASWSPIERIMTGRDLVVIGMGPVIGNVIKATSTICDRSFDVWVVREPSCSHLPDELLDSVRNIKKVFIIEEHYAAGGLAESLAIPLLKLGLPLELKHFFAKGYPSKLYGSQSWHQVESGLDGEELVQGIRGMC
jgi:transketolase